MVSHIISSAVGAYIALWLWTRPTKPVPSKDENDSQVVSKDS